MFLNVFFANREYGIYRFFILARCSVQLVLSLVYVFCCCFRFSFCGGGEEVGLQIWLFTVGQDLFTLKPASKNLALIQIEVRIKLKEENKSRVTVNSGPWQRVSRMQRALSKDQRVTWLFCCPRPFTVINELSIFKSICIWSAVQYHGNPKCTQIIKKGIV